MTARDSVRETNVQLIFYMPSWGLNIQLHANAGFGIARVPRRGLNIRIFTRVLEGRKVSVNPLIYSQVFH